MPDASISFAFTPVPETVISVPLTFLLRLASESPAFISTKPVASIKPALTPSPSILMFPPVILPSISTRAPEEFTSIEFEPSIVPIIVRPFVFKVISSAATEPEISVD